MKTPSTQTWQNHFWADGKPRFVTQMLPKQSRHGQLLSWQPCRAQDSFLQTKEGKPWGPAPDDLQLVAFPNAGNFACPIQFPGQAPVNQHQQRKSHDQHIPSKTLAILCLSAFMNSALSTARDIYVDTHATGAADGTNWGDAYTNMAAAVADANGVIMADNIHVAAGHYVNFFPYIVTDPCTVRSNGSGPVIFENITFARPVFEIDHTDIHFFDIEFHLSATHVYGHRSGVRFDRCEFTQARLSSVVGDQCTLMQFDQCNFSHNSSPGPGGAILSNDSLLVTIHDSVFSKNSSSDNGGAVHSINNTALGRVECHNTRFVNNESARNGGGISMVNTNATLINNVLTLNHARQGGAIAFKNAARNQHT